MNRKVFLLCVVFLGISAPLCWADASHPWHNDANALDVDANGKVEALDVLIIINKLNSGGGGAVPLGPMPLLSTGNSSTTYVDTTNDNKVTPLDALVVVNGLNSGTVAKPNPEPGSMALGSIALMAFLAYAYRCQRLAAMKQQLVAVRIRSSR